MSKADLSPPRGTRDFYPEDLRQRAWLFGHFREVARRFGFEEVDAPLVEHAALYQRKAGEEIVDQLYHFELHERHLALRPELTPSLARMVMARQGALRFPLRWSSIPQCWRYERMTRGRRREHYQWNMDVWGEPDVTAEAELIAALFAATDAMGLDAGDVKLAVNHRRLLEDAVRRRVPDVGERFQPLCVVLDKLGKIGAEAVVEQAADPAGPVALPRAVAAELVASLAAKGLDEAGRLAGPDSEALAELRRLLDLLDAYGLADHVDFDASVVRGLAYYTGIVFEANDAAGKLRAVAGGGRYDQLVESLGGKPLPAVGFGFGDAVIHELLAERKRLPNLSRGLDAVVFPFSEAERAVAVGVAKALRDRGKSVELVLGPVKPKRALADADRAGAATIYLLGPDERERGVVRVRDLATGEERLEPLPEAP
ncbi:MAG: histidine--tRNA ligase [Myxococcota bacterium]